MTNRPAGCRELAFLSIVLIASCLACGAAPQASWADCPSCVADPDPIVHGHDEEGRRGAIELAMATSVMLLDMKAPGDLSLHVVCSANWIAADLFLTAHHCAVAAAMSPAEHDEHGEEAGRGEYDIIGRPVQYGTWGDLVPDGIPGADVDTFKLAIVAAVDPVNDLAIMRSLHYSVVTWAGVATRPLIRGERLHAIVHHSMLTYSYCEGYVAHPHRFWPSVNGVEALMTIVQAATDCWFGSSGGSYLSADGEIVGVMSAIIRGRPELSVLVHHDPIRALLAKVQASQKK